MTELSYIIQISIHSIVVDERYYSFKYHVCLNGEAHETRTFSDSHSRRDDIEEFKRTLEDGFALELACQRLEFSY